LKPKVLYLHVFWNTYPIILNGVVKRRGREAPTNATSLLRKPTTISWKKI
jgi:hypothetical protein